jgi:hypothetical protein
MPLIPLTRANVSAAPNTAFIFPAALVWREEDAGLRLVDVYQSLLLEQEVCMYSGSAEAESRETGRRSEVV